MSIRLIGNLRSVPYACRFSDGLFCLRFTRVRKGSTINFSFRQKLWGFFRQPQNSLFHKLKVVSQSLLRHWTLAQLQVGCRIVVNVVDAHLILDGEASHCRIFISTRVIITRCDESVARQHLRLASQVSNFLEVMKVKIVTIEFTQFFSFSEVSCKD